jgi:TolB-like protein/Flp pilus assembly protein TadD
VGFVTSRLVRRRSPAAPIRSLAVLPLENLSRDTSQEYFADGMTDELITELARIPNLRVVSRSSAMREKGTRKPLDQIARELNVDAVVEGSVIHVADKVRITAQLTDTRTDKELWAQSFEGGAGDILTLQDDVAREIAAQAKVALAPGAHAGVSEGKRIDPAAHDAYLRGLYFLDRRETEKSIDYFQQAISIDSAYAAAFAGLADALYTKAAYNEASYAEILPPARAAAEHAIEIDPTNGEAHSVLGILQAQGEWNWEAAERDLRRGIALSPSDSSAIVKYAIYLDAVGRPEEAVTQMRKAVELDPLSFFMNRHLGSTLYFARHYDEALYYLRRAGEIDPNAAPIVENWISFIYEKKGLQDEAVSSDLKALSPDLPPAQIDSLRSAYQRGGWKAYHKARLELTASYGDELCNAWAIGLGYLRIGERDRALSLFGKAVDHHCVWMTFVKVDPLLDDIRTDPRFDALVQRMKLPQ